MNKKPSQKSKLIFKICLLAAAATIMIGLLAFVGKKPDESGKIVTSNFASYDIARALTEGTNYKLELLVKPGTDIHHYEPSQQDIIDIQNSTLFLYVGGESEEWIENIKTDNMNIVKYLDVDGIRKLQEDGEDEIDEHIWTSLANYSAMLNATKAKLIEIDPKNSQLFEENAKNYQNKIDDLRKELNSIAPNLPTLIFADRFPNKYIFDEYGINYIAAFSGCSEDTEADPATLSKIISYTKKSKAKYIFTIELSDQKLAKTVSNETGAEILTYQSLQNISSEDFEKGKTYIDLMNENFEALKKLQ